MVFRYAGGNLSFNRRPLLMGVVNVTPDSFSDGGEAFAADTAIGRVGELLAEGADIIDIGGESSRPGADAVPEAEEIARVAPVVDGARRRYPECVISIDTRKSAVAVAALELGANIINDISGLAHDPGMAALAAKFGAGLILMHSRGEPENMQTQKHLVYRDVVAEVAEFLSEAAAKAMAAGVDGTSIMIDPGIGFAKTMEHNLALVGAVKRLRAPGFPLLMGVSRKSMIGAITGEPVPARRDGGTIGASTWMAANGVDVLRVHNVKATRDAITVFKACEEAAANG